MTASPFAAILQEMFDHFVGSKGAEGVWQRIISEMPPHRVYIEAFLGAGVILRRKRPAAITIGVDADPAVIKMWRACPADYGEAAGAGPTFIYDDAISFLAARRWEGGELVYADPPYLLTVRSCQRDYYRHEFCQPKQHQELLRLLKSLPCMVMISGYHSALYARELAGWRVVEIPSVNRRGKPTVEVLWCNFPRPAELHDYRYLGSNFRERERINKRKRRWIARLARMDALERGALLAALQVASPFPAIRTATSETAMEDPRDPLARIGDGGRALSPEMTSGAGVGIRTPAQTAAR